MVAAVDIWNAQAEDTLLKIDIGKPLGYLGSLGIFHNDNGIRPAKLLLCNGPIVVKTCGLGLEAAPEELFGGFASVLSLIADKEDVHERAERQMSI